MKYILLTGIHAVGKTTLLRRISNDIKIINESISNLIRNSGKKINPINKYTDNIDENQYLWKQELNKLKIENNEILILDGHFTLKNRKGDIEELPFKTFEDTGIEKIILKKENPIVIQTRLKRRDNSNWTIEDIENFQNTEEKRAISYSVHKKIPLFVYDSDYSYSDLIDFILK